MDSSSQNEAIQTFQAVTGLDDPEIARNILIEHGWDINRAVEVSLNGSIPRSNGPSNSDLHMNSRSSPPSSLNRNSNLSRNNNGGRNNMNSGPFVLLRLAQSLSNLPIIGYGFKLIYWCLFYSMSPLRYIIRSLTSPYTSTITDARNFASIFEGKYGILRPAWIQQSYRDAIATSHAMEKYLLLYIHSPLHQDTDRFCRQILCSNTFVSFSNDNILCWGGSIDTKEGYTVGSMLRATTYPFLAIVKPSLTSTGRYQITILDRYEGLCPTDYLLNKITSAIDKSQTVLDRELAHKRALEANRNLREEQERELAETMAIDQERMRKAKADREAKAKAEEEENDAAELAEAMKLSEMLNVEAEIQRKKEIIVPEPAKGKGVTQFRINIPKGGRLQRRFPNSSKMLDLFNYIDVEFASKNIGIDNYELATNYPKRTFAAEDKDLTLSEAGLIGNINLFIYDLNV